jgi:hypothetical protein
MHPIGMGDAPPRSATLRDVGAGKKFALRLRADALSRPWLEPRRLAGAKGVDRPRFPR